MLYHSITLTLFYLISHQLFSCSTISVSRISNFFCLGLGSVCLTSHDIYRGAPSLLSGIRDTAPPNLLRPSTSSFCSSSPGPSLRRPSSPPRSRRAAPSATAATSSPPPRRP